MPARTLVLLRHAKSSWADSALGDYDRPLNKRGRRDAPEMADRLRRRGLAPDLILTSGALRTRQTAAALVAALDLDESRLAHDSALYLASEERLLRRIQALDDGLRQVVLVAHNPGLTELVRRLGVADLENLPTCGYAEFSLALESWGLVGPQSARLVRLDYPKHSRPDSTANRPEG